ncbi:MAG TPA: hypothetical protein PK668_26820 [Myxococcota bacterium]|nr:hypothetical protein [Myxococcota bacterium]HRY97142.1 hypothetical protein [Myxococcota bacterium]HSA23604.1 hypothetical protein [Myxococcota bacterium]
MRTHGLWIGMLVLGLLLPGARAGDLDPSEGGFFSLGWNAKGTRFAYGWFATTIMISNGSRIALAVQDVVEDKELWQGGQTWDQGNAGGGEEGYDPRTLDKAWEEVAASAVAGLQAQGIRRAPPAPPSAFPLARGGDSIRVEVQADPDKNTFEVWAVSDKLGRKKISSGESFDQVQVEGYYLNPDGSRMAVVINVGMRGAYPGYQVIGCHLRAGFKKDAGPR